MVAIPKSQADQCKDECTKIGQRNDRCCNVPCSFRKLKVLKDARKKNDSAAVINWHGLANSVLFSVNNDTRWVPVVKKSAEYCYNQNINGTSVYDCDVIPMSLYDIIDCIYAEDFLNCPVWNPNQIPECKYTREFIENC